MEYYHGSMRKNSSAKAAKEVHMSLKPAILNIKQGTRVLTIPKRSPQSRSSRTILKLEKSTTTTKTTPTTTIRITILNRSSHSLQMTRSTTSPSSMISPLLPPSGSSSIIPKTTTTTTNPNNNPITSNNHAVKYPSSTLPPHQSLTNSPAPAQSVVASTPTSPQPPNAPARREPPR
ncbi:hypothetical protein DM02DRAFT_77915 [Periconia macrospinosa]|uniref:Uncharacterized protein n=1 Tax=Periconia macrospinosa TaxID=97972 RepID=A0A2V1DHC9_9PLEO|nr:hypothetical protein DM02DRAFT_77915 [Periconia macrospinosa]